jgi:very-short-patch-repair endonuclease
MHRYHYKNYREISLLARDLRKNPTRSEELVWEILRRKLFSGYRFLRQHPVFYRIDKEWIEFFIADFYCSRLKLVIEINGEVHESRKDYDSERDAKLSNKGISVIRIKNEEVGDINLLISKIISIIKSRESFLSDR